MTSPASGVWLNYSTYNYGVGIFSITNPAAPVLLNVYCPSPTAKTSSNSARFATGLVTLAVGAAAGCISSP